MALFVAGWPVVIVGCFLASASLAAYCGSLGLSVAGVGAVARFVVVPACLVFLAVLVCLRPVWFVGVLSVVWLCLGDFFPGSFLPVAAAAFGYGSGFPVRSFCASAPLGDASLWLRGPALAMPPGMDLRPCLSCCFGLCVSGWAG